jgi:tetratricopeptide (TPR) repeat protein
MVEEDREELGDAIKEFNRGLDSHIEGRLDKALKCFLTALPTFQEFGAEEMIAGTFHEIGMVLQDNGELDEALDYYQKSLALSEKLKYMPGCAKTLFQIGTLYEAKGDVISADDYYRKSKESKVKKPGGLKFIIVVFILMGLNLLGIGLIALSGALAGMDVPPFLKPEAWVKIVSALTTFGPFLLAFGIVAIAAGIGLYLLKGIGWVLGIFTSLMSVMLIVGVVFYWYLSKETIQELYNVK